MIKATQISKGMVIIQDGEPWKVIGIRYTMSGRGSNSISTKLRSILTGSQSEKRFRSDDKVEKAFIEIKEFEYLYADGDDHYFMDTENYEQIMLKEDELGDVLHFVLPNTTCNVQIYDGKPIGVEAPAQVRLKVKETEPGLKGATASSNVTKPATLETGVVVQVPMFIENGETLIIQTATGEYQGREK